MKAVLVLEDGTVFEGKSFGAQGITSGEVVFNTSMAGYQEIMTDPSYTGQIVAMTYPLIGNYGVNDQYVESARPQAKGMIVREHSLHPNNFASQNTLHNYLEKHGVVGLWGVDTRAITKKLRTNGTMGGVMAAGENLDMQQLQEKLKSACLTGPHIVRSVTTSTPYQIAGDGPKVVVLDFGIKQSILRNLKSIGCDLTVVPSFTSYEEIMSLNPDGIFLSNGPGDPKDVPEAVTTVQKLLGIKPMFGICLGHQIMGLAMGADTFKLKFGHRGGNQPVQDLETGKVYITSQNHGYAVDWQTVGNQVAVTHKNLNDNTVEGIKHKEKRAFSVQYHPEAVPGPEDSKYLFDEFLTLINQARLER